MQRYRSALNHLTIALDEMVETGDTLIVANIAYPIQLIELAILDNQRVQCERATMRDRTTGVG